MSSPGAAFTPPQEDATAPLIEAFIKSNWASHYRKAWEKLGTPTGLRPSGTTWNWPAALIPMLWMLYRRLWLYAFGWFVLSSALGVAIPDYALWTWLASIILFGMYGDRILLARAWRASDAALRQYGPGDQALAAVSKQGGTSMVFLFIPLFIVFTGIVAAIAIPKFASVKQKAYRTMMESDLSNFNTLEQESFSGTNRFVGDFASFAPSKGVSRPKVTLSTDSTGYIATVTHERLTGWTCAVSVNVTNPIDSTAGNGQPACRR